jgi:hypothetical protein
MQYLDFFPVFMRYSTTILFDFEMSGNNRIKGPGEAGSMMT